MSVTMLPDHSGYMDEKGSFYFPVTTVIGITPRAVNFSELPYQDKVQKARERGTMLHGEIENCIKTGDTGLFPTTEWFALNLLPKYTDWESEQIVFSDEQYSPYAGTIDAICRDGENHILMDFKFGGHETVDYQLSLYKRAYCKNRNVSPDKVKLFCIDFHDEDNIRVLPIRTIEDSWLDALLYCFETGEKYAEPHLALAAMPESTLMDMESVEIQILQIEDTLKELTALKDTYRKDLYKAMTDHGMSSFEFGSIKATVVPLGKKTEFDLEGFKKAHPEIDLSQFEKTVIEVDQKALQKAYPKEYLGCTFEKQSKAGYLRVTIKDSTEGSDEA